MVTMNNLERFCLHNEMKPDNKIHDKYTAKPNILFDMKIWNRKNTGAKVITSCVSQALDLSLTSQEIT
jgi:hypothetical protein